MPTDALVLVAAVCASLETLDYSLQRLLSKNCERLLRCCLMAKTRLEELLDKLGACKCGCHVEAERIFSKITDPESTCTACDCPETFRRIDSLGS